MEWNWVLGLLASLLAAMIAGLPQLPHPQVRGNTKHQYPEALDGIHRGYLCNCFHQSSRLLVWRRIIRVSNVPLLPLFQGVCLKRQKRKLPMLLLLPLFQAVCGNKIKKTQSSQCYYCYLCSRVFVWKDKNKSYQCYYCQAQLKL